VSVAVLVVHLAEAFSSRSKGIRGRVVGLILSDTDLKAHEGTISGAAKKVMELSCFVLGIELAGAQLYAHLSAPFSKLDSIVVSKLRRLGDLN